ncbi:hypothetical protein D9757_012370 [Collybiopsis confluens]|uniref:Flavin-containing monooxygenase n=1 Tax=Collybiopsis confluens TaxID=2823264 RepID=A0A8H5LHP6_9AGAR|nr:hypothetical protein D9757_012370 [Collybiopsis confluens]
MARDRGYRRSEEERIGANMLNGIVDLKHMLERCRALVVGNGNSANDIAAHLAPVAQNPIYRSIRRSAFKHFVHLPDPRIQDVAPIKRFSVQDNDKARVELHDGTLLQDIDVVFICSGYIPNPTFLHIARGYPHLCPKLILNLLKAGEYLRYNRHILYAHNPTLAFMGSVMCFTPFTIADVSSTWLGLAWSNEVAYPASAKDRLQFEKDLIEDIERRRADEAQETGREASSLLTYSALGSLEEDYAAGLKRDIVAARPEMKDVLPDWNATTKAVRESMYTVKYRSLLWLKKQREQGALDEAVDGEDAGYRTQNVPLCLFE